MSASSHSHESPTCERSAAPVSPFDFAIAPHAPRSALRCAPFVVLGALMMYAVIVVTALTGSTTTGDTEELNSMSSRSVAYVVPSTTVVMG